MEFVGVDDPHLGCDRLRGGRPGRLDPTAALTVGVTHAPYQRVLDAMAADGAGLVLAGHTHGGQLCVPGYGALVTNCDLDRGRAKGLSRWWPGAGTLGGGRSPRRRRTPPGWRCPPVSAPPRTRRCGSPAGPRRRC